MNVEKQNEDEEFSCFLLVPFSFVSWDLATKVGGVCDLHLAEFVRRQHVVLISQKKQSATQYAPRILYFTKKIKKLVSTSSSSVVVAAAVLQGPAHKRNFYFHDWTTRLMQASFGTILHRWRGRWKMYKFKTCMSFSSLIPTKINVLKAV